MYKGVIKILYTLVSDLPSVIPTHQVRGLGSLPRSRKVERAELQYVVDVHREMESELNLHR